jgi:hypothetical protein
MKWEKLLKENIDKSYGLIMDLQTLVDTWRPETEEGHRYKHDLQQVINKWSDSKENIHSRWN